MLLFLSQLAFAVPGTAASACIDALPSTPDKADRRTGDEIRAMLTLNQRPTLLIPLKFEEHGVDKYQGTWRDETGGRWSWGQVRTLFDGEPYSATHLQAMRSAASVAREGESSASFRMAEVHAAAFNQGLGGGVSVKHGIITPRKYRTEHKRYKDQMAIADTFEAGDRRFVGRAMCAFNMAPALHAERGSRARGSEDPHRRSRSGGRSRRRHVESGENAARKPRCRRARPSGCTDRTTLHGRRPVYWGAPFGRRRRTGRRNVGRGLGGGRFVV